MRFLLDEHIPRAVARYLTEAGHDLVRVVDANLRGASDDELAVWAKLHSRILVSRDGDFLNDIRFPPEDFGGFIVLQSSDDSPVGLRRAVKVLLERLGDVDLAGKLVIIDDAGIRVRPESG